MSGRKIEQSEPSALVRIEEGTVAFSAWMNHYRASGQIYTANYWSARGYAFVPGRYPPTSSEDK